MRRATTYLLAALITVAALSNWQSALADPQEVVQKTTERGPVTVTLTLTPSQPVIGDTITLTLEVVADEGVELLMPEFGTSLDRFSIIDFVPRESINEQGATVASQRYRLQPPMSGKLAIPPLMIEFVDRRPGQRQAPDGEDAYEILTERLPFEVSSIVPDDADADLKPPLGKLEALATPGAPWWPALLGITLLLALIAPFAWRYWNTWRARARQRSAFDIADSRLRQLLSMPRPDSSHMDAFFVELSDIIRHYLEDRFALHAPELTTEEFLDVASGSPDLNAAHKGFLRDFLEHADQVKFARYVPDADYVEVALSSTGNFLEQTRTETPLIVEEDHA